MGFESKIEALVQNKKFKKFLSRLYGLGASVVILGALFKIEHWPGASIMLSAGLITESIIFFFFAFDSTPEDPHESPNAQKDVVVVYDADGQIIQGASLPIGQQSVNNQGSVALARFDEMLLEAEISSETFERLGMGIRKLGETTENLNSMGDVAEASHRYLKTLESADESLDKLTKTYESAIGKVTSSTLFKYKTIAKSLSVIEQETVSYQQQIETLNDHLSVLNKLYGRQRKESEKYLHYLSESADESAKYQEKMKELNGNIQSLNDFYGGVLTSLKVKHKRLY
jgi:gliding motility-associated protein GldL